MFVNNIESAYFLNCFNKWLRFVCLNDLESLQYSFCSCFSNILTKDKEFKNGLNICVVYLQGIEAFSLSLKWRHCDSLRMPQWTAFPISPLLLKRARLWQETNFYRVKNEILKELTYPKFNQKLDLGIEKMNSFA